jgi:hypothetical protein
MPAASLVRYLLPYSVIGSSMGDLVPLFCKHPGLDDVEVRCSEGNCGLFARRDFTAKEEVLRIPQNLTLVPEDGPEDELDGKGLVQLALLQQRALAEKSLWAPYVATLPTEVGPAFTLTPDDLQLLNGTQSWGPFEDSMQGQLEQARVLCLYGREHDASLPTPLVFSDFHVDACQWAVTMMKSRAFAVKHPKTGVPRPALVPVLDM